MRRSSLAFASLFAAAVLDAAACNSISGVGDFTFTTASSSGSGGGTSSSTAGGAAGSTSSGGGSGGGPLVVRCGNAKCPVTPDAGACCYDNSTEFPTESGRCVDNPAVNDGCITDATDAGHETRIECSRPSDCPSGHCCGTLGAYDADAGVGWYVSVTCAPSCDPSASQFELCEPDGGTCAPDADGGTLTCAQSFVLQTGYFTCK